MLLFVTMNVLSRVTINKIAEIKDPLLQKNSQAEITKIMCSPDFHYYLEKFYSRGIPKLCTVLIVEP